MSRPMKPLTPIALGPLRVTPICLGAMTFGEQVNEADAHAILDRAVERGVTFLDTAEMYPVPPSTTRSEERRVGKECRSRWSPYH